MENRVIVHSYQDNTKVKCSHCFLKNGEVYMVTESHQFDDTMLYNLTNLSTGISHSEPIPMIHLSSMIERLNFKYLGNIEIGIHEKLPLEGQE